MDRGLLYLLRRDPHKKGPKKRFAACHFGGGEQIWKGNRAGGDYLQGPNRQEGKNRKQKKKSSKVTPLLVTVIIHKEEGVVTAAKVT